ncbi:hypothetical protein AAFF_G00439420 [Aldrovandia affinis]|uniref:Uncharacterized protein n=1 Tax=Aldrovandia affinis TaxID=143900 RepID=A0AAD7WHW2_9TELE|nr:hypothetical protein AAFF_G00439420 [Aldrovandia affinis]
MSSYVAFHTRLTSIVDILAKAAVAEICELVDDGYAVLHLELTRSKKENECLKRKLRMIESSMTRGSGERTGHSCSEAQVCSDKKIGEDVTSVTAERDFSVGCQLEVWRDAEPKSVDNEATPVHSPGNKSADMEDERVEMIIIKKEGLDEDVETSDPQCGLKVHDERAVESDDRASIEDTQTAPATDTEELTEQHRTRHSVWKDSGLDAVLKAEPEHEAVNLQHTGPDLSAGRLNSMGNDQKENEALKRKLRMMELKIARGSWERRRAMESHLKRRSSEVQVCGAFSGTARGEDNFPAAERDFSVGCQPGVSLWRDAEPTTVDEENSSVRSAVPNKSVDMEEERPETQIVKKEGLNEDVENSDPQGGLKVNEERAVETDGGERVPIVDTQTVPEELTAQHRTRHSVWEDSGLDLASIMEVLANAAVAEICELVDDGYAVLHLEISRRQKENEALQRKLQMMELRISRRCVEKPRIRIRDEIMGTASEDAEFSTEERVRNQSDLSVWKEGEPPTVDVEDTAIKSDECAGKEKGRPESLLIKKEKLEEDLENSDPPERLNINEERSVESDCGERAPIVDTQTAPATDTEALTEQHRTRHSVWEDSGLDTVLKAETEIETINLLDTESDHGAEKQKNLPNEHVLYERPGQLDTFYTRGFAEKDTESPVCSYTAAADSVTFPVHSELQPIASAGNGEMHLTWNKEPMPGLVQTSHRRYREDRRRERLQLGNAPFPPQNHMPVQEHTGPKSSGPDVNGWAPCEDHFAKPRSVKAPYRMENCFYWRMNFTCI